MLVAGKTVITGAEAFKLHDTFGYSIDELEFAAAEHGVAVDRAGFEREMNEQRTRARAASKFGRDAASERAPWRVVHTGPDSAFTGYDATSEDGARIVRWRERGDELEFVLERTPCYAESGGQVGDRGTLRGPGVAATLEQVFREDDAIVHRVRFERGDGAALLAASAEGALTVAVDPALRTPTQRHHTATHLLHAALRTVLGEHVHQAGSLVAPDRLRFDYAHFEAPDPDQLATIEHRVNDWVLANREVSWRELPIDEAKAQGAMALFGEKYGSRVRMVTVDGVPEAGIEPSRELCGGTHVRRTGDIGAFVLVGETAIASGVRRVEALCGAEALRWLKHQNELLQQAAHTLQTPPASVPAQIEKLKSELAELRRAQSDASKLGLEAEFARLAAGATAAPRGRWLVAELAAGAETNAVRDAADRLRGALGTGAAVLALRNEGKLTFLAAVSDDLVAARTLNASDLVKRVAQVTGGSGGGKPHLALAGGKDAGKLADALDEARRLLGAALGG